MQQQAPKLRLTDQDNKTVSLEDYRGKWVVLYFYPKDDTPGCTIEAIEFTKDLKEFEKLNAVVLGVSPDSVKSHCNFIAKHKLKVRLLSDPDKKVVKKYKVWKLKKLYGREYYGINRSTFLIDPKGNIATSWSNVKVKGHVDEVKEKIKELR